tara:strand:+ start:6077 stop:7306 length:1230 start_codon:yes stop_codon:yes gene_type:complete
MYLYNYQYLKNKKTHFLIFLFIFSLLIRIPSVFFFGDTSLENEWSIIVDNLVNYNKFSFLRFDGFFVPNVFMPPLYAFYLYFFKIFNFSNEIYIQLILFSQCVLSSFSVVIFYMINKFFFSNKISILGALIFSIFPLHIFACGQISSIILQSFLTIMFFYFFIKISKKNNFFNIFILSLASGLLMLLRAEFLALFIFSIFYLAFFSKINIKSILIMVLLTLFVISPYLIRNIIVLDTATITKSIGFNLWKGNNPNAKVEGNPDYQANANIVEQVDRIPKDKRYHINFDKIFLDEGLKNIKNDPLKYLKLYIEKVLSFIFMDINSSYYNYYHPLHYIPVLFIGITSIVGIILSNKKSFHINFFMLFFIVQVAMISVFFILPRYKLAIIPLQIIFSNILFEYMKNKLAIKK